MEVNETSLVTDILLNIKKKKSAEHIKKR